MKCKLKKIILAICALAILPTITVYAKGRAVSGTSYFGAGHQVENSFVDLERANHCIVMNQGTGKTIKLTMRESLNNAIDPARATLTTNGVSGRSSYALTNHAKHYIRFESNASDKGAGGYAMIYH